MAAANFLILYSSKEGSSAIISNLSAQKNICVPIFEEMDKYRFGKAQPDASLSKSMGEIFQTGKFDLAPFPDFSLRKKTKDSEFVSVGFKWRFWGDIKDLQDIVKRHNITVFILSRRDFLELACSNYIETDGKEALQGGTFIPHPQFSFSFATGDEKANLTQLLLDQKFSFDASKFSKTIAYRLYAKQLQLKAATALVAAELPIAHIYYEDFCADQAGFTRKFLAKIGQESLAEIDPFCAFSKFNKQSNANLIADFKKLSQSEPLKTELSEVSAQYADLLAQLDALAAKKEGDG